MNHDTSYLHSEYARSCMIESYRIEEKEKIKQREEKGATAQAGIMLPPERRKDDDRQNN